MKEKAKKSQKGVLEYRSSLWEETIQKKKEDKQYKKEYKKKKALEAIAAYQRSLQADKQNNIQILRARKEKLR